MDRKKLLYLLPVIICWSCTQNVENSKIQNKRDHVVKLREKVKEIEFEDVPVSYISSLYIIDKYFIITDHHSTDKLIHLFEKENFNYVTSVGNRGLGPNEITNIGKTSINEVDRKFYVSDHGNRTILSFSLDSVLNDPQYFPKEQIKVDENQLPYCYQYFNDTLSIGTFTLPIGNADYRPKVGKWNMSTGEIKQMKYEHPDIEKKRASFAVSTQHEIYVECYWHHDLITICDLNGDLKCNIYGRRWNNKKTNRINFYREVQFCKDKIIALYCDGENNFKEGRNGEVRPNYPSKFIVFDINGDYIQTLDIEYNIQTFCFDKDNNRIIMALDDEIQFACLDLGDLV